MSKRTGNSSRALAGLSAADAFACLMALLAAVLPGDGPALAGEFTPCDINPCQPWCPDPDCNPLCGGSMDNENCLMSACGGPFGDCQASCCPCDPSCGDRLADVSVWPDLTWIGDVVTGTVCSGDVTPNCYELVVTGAEFTTQDFACPLRYPSLVEPPPIYPLLTPDPFVGPCELTWPADEEWVWLPASYTFHLFTNRTDGCGIYIFSYAGGARHFSALSLDLALGETDFPERSPEEDQEPGRYLGVNDDFDEGKPTEDWEDPNPVFVPHLPGEVAVVRTDDMVRLYLDLIGDESYTCGSGRVSVKLSTNTADKVRVLAINPQCRTLANCGEDPECPTCYKEITSEFDVAPDYLLGSRSDWEFYLEGLHPGTVVLTAKGIIDGDPSRKRIDEVLFKVVKIDVDVDSDNTKTAAPYGPNETIEEDRIEQRQGEPGRYILLNDDDDNRNGEPDNDPMDIGPIQNENDLVQINFAAPGFTPHNPDYVKWTLSVPDAVDLWQTQDKNGLRVRGGRDTEMPWTGIPGFPLPQTWYIQGLQPGGPAQLTARLWIDLDEEGPGGYTMVHEDIVQLTVVDINIETDSDNNGVINAADNMIEDDFPGRAMWPNADNDNSPDNHADLEEQGQVLGENDLVPVNVDVIPANPNLMVRLEVSPANLVTVWLQPDKTTLAPMLWNAQELPYTLWVEGLDQAGTATLTLSLVSSPGAKDSVKMTVFKVSEVHWDAYPGNGALAACPGARNAGSMCTYPEARDFYETPVSLAIRRRVEIEGTIIPAPTKPDLVRVHLRSWDVDDPSADGDQDGDGSLADEVDGEPVTAGAFVPLAGPDNRGTDPAQAGELVPQGPNTSGSSCLAGANGSFVYSFFKVTRQPGDNFAVSATTTPQLNENWLTQAEADARMPAGGLVPPANAAAVSQMLTVRRTLWVELDSMAAPILPGDGPFDGAGVGNDDVNPGNLGDVNIGLLAPEFDKAYVNVGIVPPDVDLSDETAFIHNYANYDNLVSGVRDKPSDSLLWVVQVLAAYEGIDGEDHDPDAVEPACLGITNRGPSNSACHIFQETIRDASTNVPGAVPTVILEQRIVLHECLHHFGISHAVPGDQTLGVIDANTNLTGSAAQNALNQAQIRFIRSADLP